MMLYLRAAAAAVFGTLFMSAFVFVPAGTFDYWQGWALMGVFTVATLAITIYLAMYDKALLERRMHSGPWAERELPQKIIMTVALVGFFALLAVPAFDHRFGWSPVSPLLSVFGDVLVALGFWLVFLVMRANSYAASTIGIQKDHRVISDGPYALVRHPMYAGIMPLLVGIPLALGSWWGIGVPLFFLPVLIWRLLHEEKFLHANLPGYTAYTEHVRYRLIPYVW